MIERLVGVQALTMFQGSFYSRCKDVWFAFIGSPTLFTLFRLQLKRATLHSIPCKILYQRHLVDPSRENFIMAHDMSTLSLTFSVSFQHARHIFPCYYLYDIFRFTFECTFNNWFYLIRMCTLMEATKTLNGSYIL